MVRVRSLQVPASINALTAIAYYHERRISIEIIVAVDYTDCHLLCIRLFQHLLTSLSTVSVVVGTVVLVKDPV